MAKLLAIVFIIGAVTSCGSTNAASGPPVAPSWTSFHAAPTEGSPEQAAIDLGRGVPNSPADGVPGDAGD